MSKTMIIVSPNVNGSSIYILKISYSDLVDETFIFEVVKYYKLLYISMI